MVVLKNPLLIAFERIATLKTVHAAAADLLLTQAAVTKRLRQLEGDLGATLFLRSRKGMSLTDEGKALLQFCKSTNEAEGLLISKLKGSNAQNVTLTIAGPTSAMSSRINIDCLHLYSKYPFLKLHFIAEDHVSLVSLVKQGKIDLAVVAPNFVPNEMDSKLLKPDKYILVGSHKWKGRRLAEILSRERIIDFYENDMTTFNYLKKFELMPAQSSDRLYVNNNSALIRMIIFGIGYGTLTETIATPFLDSGELIKLNHGQIFEESLALTWFPRHEKPDYFRTLINSIK